MKLVANAIPPPALIHPTTPRGEVAIPVGDCLPSPVLLEREGRHQAEGWVVRKLSYLGMQYRVDLAISHTVTPVLPHPGRTVVPWLIMNERPKTEAERIKVSATDEHVRGVAEALMDCGRGREH